MLGHPDRDVTRTPPQACVGQAPGAPPTAFQSLTWERKTATDTSKRLAAAKTTSIPPDSARWPVWIRSLVQIAFLLAAFVLFARAPR